jgi:hypothetical protein
VRKRIESCLGRRRSGYERVRRSDRRTRRRSASHGPDCMTASTGLWEPRRAVPTPRTVRVGRVVPRSDHPAPARIMDGSPPVRTTKKRTVPPARRNRVTRDSRNAKARPSTDRGPWPRSLLTMFTKQVSGPMDSPDPPSLPPRRSRSSELEERPGHGPDPRFLCPSRTSVGHALKPIGFRSSISPNHDRILLGADRRLGAGTQDVSEGERLTATGNRSCGDTADIPRR